MSRSVLFIHSLRRVFRSSNELQCFILFYTENPFKLVKRYLGDWMWCSSVFTLLSPHFFILPIFSPTNSMSCSSQLTSCSPYWLSCVPLQTGLASLQREWFMALNEWMKSHIFPVFRFGLFRVVTIECAALFQLDTLMYFWPHKW